jgi:hypothetical protein
MAIERLKFRCYRCNQLLAAAPSKAGTVVSCPKCQTDLLIPGAEPRVKGDRENRAKSEVERPAGTEALARSEIDLRARAEAAAILGSSPVPPQPEPVPSVLGELAGVIPADLADLRPEDLRVEAEFFESLTRVSQASANVEPAPWPALESLTPAVSFEPLAPSVSFQPAAETPSETGPSEAALPAPHTVDLVPMPSESSSRAPEVSAVVPQIEIEPPTILPAGTEIRRVSEVILPASVVLAWSLFVLAGITMAFVAGLLMGHFLWKTH